MFDIISLIAGGSVCLPATACCGIAWSDACCDFTQQQKSDSKWDREMQEIWSASLPARAVIHKDKDRTTTALFDTPSGGLVVHWPKTREIDPDLADWLIHEQLGYIQEATNAKKYGAAGALFLPVASACFASPCGWVSLALCAFSGCSWISTWNAFDFQAQTAAIDAASNDELQGALRGLAATQEYQSKKRDDALGRLMYAPSGDRRWHAIAHLSESQRSQLIVDELRRRGTLVTGVPDAPSFCCWPTTSPEKKKASQTYALEKDSKVDELVKALENSLGLPLYG